MTALRDNLFAGAIRLRESLPESVRAKLWVPAVIIIVFLVIRVIVRRVVPWAGRLMLSPAVIDAAGAALLLVNFLLAQPFRLFRVRVPAWVFALGDATISMVAAAHQGARTARRSIARLSRVRLWMVATTTAGIIAWWNTSVCLSPGDSASSSTACTSPVAAWVQEVRRASG
jgi:hypothetical protein